MMNQTNPNILLITGEGGLGDRSFNDAGFAGARRAMKELNVGVDLVELHEIGDLTEDTYASAAAMKKYSLIVGLGFYQDTIANATAKKFPDQKFILIDAKSSEPNVRGILFKEEENAFLAGILAAYQIKQLNLQGLVKNKMIGVLLGMDAPHLTRYAFSYEAGAKTIDPEIEILVDVVGSFIDREKAKQLAISQIGKGASVIFQVAGASGLGVFDAVSEKGGYAIGEGQNQNALHPEFIIASTYKHMDLAVFESIKFAINNEFVGGNHFYGFKDNYLEVSLDGSNVEFSEEAKQALTSYRQKFVDEAIKTPLTESDLKIYLQS